MRELAGPAPIVERAAFWLEPDVAFLNHGSFGAAPRAVLAAQTRWREQLEREPVRFMMHVLPDALRSTADRLGAFLGAQGRDLAWVDNASTGIQAVLNSVHLDPGDTIVTCSHVYNAVRNAARHATERAGARVIEVHVPWPLPAGPTNAGAADDAIVAAFASVIGPDARLVIVDHVTSFSGLVFPVERVAALCQERGVPLLVDGAHAPGMLPVQLDRLGSLGVHWYVGNLHKWLFAPKGCGFLWARRDRQAGLHPAVISHGYGKGFVEEFDWTGTRDPSPWLSLDAVFGFVDESGGIEAIRAHNEALQAAAGAWLSERWGVAIPSPSALRRSLCTLPVPSRAGGQGTPEQALALQKALQDRGVQVPFWSIDGRLWLRISAQVYNRPVEYVRLGDALPDAVAEVLG